MVGGFLSLRSPCAVFWGLLGDEADFFGAALLQEDDAVDDAVVVGVGVALDEDGQIRMFGERLGGQRGYVFRQQRLFVVTPVQVVAAAGVHAEDERQGVVTGVSRHFEGVRAGIGQVDFDALLVDERGGDHEDDEEHEHNVDVGDDVHFGFEFVAAVAAHAGFLCCLRW